MVRSRFLKLDSSHIEFVMECLHNNTTEIRNMKQYLLTVLFNAPTTMNNHYTAQVNHDMHARRLVMAAFLLHRPRRHDMNQMEISKTRSLEASALLSRAARCCSAERM